MASTAELEAEILADLEENPDAYTAPVNDVITIDPETRTINIPASETLFGTEQEMNVERKYFKCPKIVGDNIDLSKHQIYITYVTAKDNTGTFLPEEEPGLYYCEDMAVDGDYITFSWLLSGNVLNNHGFIAFAVSAKHMDGEVLKTRWKTKPAVGTVLLTVPDGEAIVERYPDIITQLLDKMNAVEEIATPEAMQNYVDAYFGRNPVQPVQLDSTLTDPEKAAPANVVGELRGDIDDLSSSKITKFYASNLGETHITDSDNGKIQDMMIYGKSLQDGTPTPDNPIEIQSVVNPVVKLINEDGLKVQTVTLNNITLNAIPVERGGNVTINGQQYIADYVDVENRKVIRNVLKWNLADKIEMGFNNGVWHINIPNLGIDGSKIGLSNMFKIQNGHYSNLTISEMYVAENGKTVSLNMRGMTDEDFKSWIQEKKPEVYNVLKVAEQIPITTEEIQAFKSLTTYYPTTNISVNSEQLDGYTIFNYPISMQNGWNYVKQQLNDNRDYIYDMDTQSVEAYVNSEYAVALTELEV